MACDLKFHELSEKQQQQARHHFPDAGTVHDDFYYVLSPGRFNVVGRENEEEGIDWICEEEPLAGNEIQRPDY